MGLGTGAGAVLFRALIGLVHNIAFLGSLSVDYDASLFTPPSPWGFFIIFVPVLGSVIVTFLITNFAPEARGHGVPEVMDAIYYKEGVIRPVVALIKSLASALSIGIGAAVGREGPIRSRKVTGAKGNSSSSHLAAGCLPGFACLLPSGLYFTTRWHLPSQRVGGSGLSPRPAQ